MTQEEFDFIKDAFSQILDDIAGNPDWYDAASAISADLGALERELGEKVVSLDKSPEEAAKEYLDEVFGEGKHQQFYKDLFIAGWKCRDDQMPMPEDTVLFNKGVAEGRRLEREDMLGDAISCEVDWYDGPILNYPIDQLCEVLSKMDIDVGDKIRIVVLKEEEE